LQYEDDFEDEDMEDYEDEDEDSEDDDEVCLGSLSTHLTSC